MDAMDAVKNVGGELVVLVVDVVALGLCLKHLFKWKRILRDLHAAPALDINERLKNKLHNEPDDAVRYVALRGLVKPLGDAIKSNSNENITGVVKKLTIKEHVVARTVSGFWSDESRTVYEMYNIIPFVLRRDAVDVEVIDALEAYCLDMDVISDHFEPLNPGLLDHIWGYFSGVRQRGLQTTEEMLRDGTLITGIGELVVKGDGSLKLQPPKDGSPLFLITSTKNSLIKKISESRDLVRVLTLIFGSVALAIASRMIYKYLKRKKKLQEEENLKRKLAVSRRERREMAREKNLTDAQLCVVCSENPKEIILLPCGHVSLCENCSDNIKDTCPICRMKIESKAPAFIT